MSFKVWNDKVCGQGEVALSWGPEGGWICVTLRDCTGSSISSILAWGFLVLPASLIIQGFPQLRIFSHYLPPFQSLARFVRCNRTQRRLVWWFLKTFICPATILSLLFMVLFYALNRQSILESYSKVSNKPYTVEKLRSKRTTHRYRKDLHVFTVASTYRFIDLFPFIIFDCQQT